MKKSLTLIALALGLFAAVSCGNRQKSAKTEEQAVEKSRDEIQAEELIKIHLDSIAVELTKVNPIGIVGDVKDGKVVLSETEKLVKPDYLTDTDATKDLQTLSQKYRAIAVLSVDKEIAKLYEMPLADYNEALAKLYADVNDPALKVFSEGVELKEAVNSFYNAAKENGREPLFWDAMTASLVEQMYIASRNTDKFLAAFTDETASSFTWYVSLLSVAIENLAAINPEYAGLNETLLPLAKINAISVVQFKEQLDGIKLEIAESHDNLLN